jgi:hypothetical protein
MSEELTNGFYGDEETEPKTEILTRGVLSDLVRMREDILELRNMESNRISAKVDVQTHSKYKEQFEAMLVNIDNDIRAAFRTHVPQRVRDWVSGVRGLAEVSVAQIMSEVDIRRATHRSSLWRYAGYGIDSEGKIDRHKKGEPSCFNSRLKTATYKVTSLQIRLSGPYARIYREAKHGYLTTRSSESALPKDQQWPLLRCELAARRKASKLFLAHLWEVWREAEGLPVSSPFVKESDGHSFISPWEMVTVKETSK